MGIEDKLSIKRRDVLAGGGVALGAAALLAGSAQATAAVTIGAWDYEADVLCVGSGAAACSAAITAVTQNASVILLEKLPLAGGTTSKSGGVIWIPNHALLRAKGIDDKRDDCLKYMARMSYPAQYDPDSPQLGLEDLDYRLLATFYDTGSQMIDHMIAAGAVDLKVFDLYHLNLPGPDYGDHLPENKVPTGRSLQPKTATLETGGQNLALGLEAWLRSRNVPILTGHRVVRIIAEGDRVIGLEAQAGDRLIRLKARKGVIFGSGGYANNAKLADRHQVALYGTCAKPGATGDLIALAAGVGAQMGPLHTAWRTQVLVEEALQNRAMAATVFFPAGDSMLMVNKYGRRALNEKQNYNDRTKAHLVYDNQKDEYPNQLMFMIFDRRCLERHGGLYPYPQDIRETNLIIQGTTLSDLANNIRARLKTLASKTGNVDLTPEFSEELVRTVTRFNGYAASGKDPEFNRGLHGYDRSYDLLFGEATNSASEYQNHSPNATMHPLSDAGPYYAFIMAAGALDTNAGPMINENAQILNGFDLPIAGLYGAGNCIASPARDGYYGPGATIAMAMTYGYLAGMHATRKAAA